MFSKPETKQPGVQCRLAGNVKVEILPERAMASTPQPVNPQPTGRQRFGTRVNRFWRRVTDGFELNQLWNQFRTDARASYSLYSREIDSAPKEGVRRGNSTKSKQKQFSLSP